MKKIFRIILPCLAFAACLTSCQESLIDDKAVIDAEHEATRLTPPTVTLVGEAANVTFRSVSADFTISDISNVEECGLFVSTDNTFKTYTVIKKDAATSVSATVTGLNELTTYYIKAYAVTKDGSTVVSDNILSATTTKTPVFDIEGNYTATDYKYNGDKEFEASGKTYTVNVAFTDASKTKVKITNLQGLGTTIEGDYDAAKGTVTVKSGTYIFTHEEYGDAVIGGVNDDISDYTETVVFKFTALGGEMETSNYRISVSAGDFGFYYTSMEHQ